MTPGTLYDKFQFPFHRDVYVNYCPILCNSFGEEHFLSISLVIVRVISLSIIKLTM